MSNFELTRRHEVLGDPAQARFVLEQLSDAGIRLALDDFGTGYSSLTNLRELPIDVIKIDRSFVKDLACDENDQRIVRSMIDLAHGLRIEVTSEGVEDAAAFELLSQYGSDSAQGYLMARPMPADALVEFIAASTRCDRLREAS
ncbi:MAG: EAL domain-containing protein [Ilumatobacteraceae bacterium]